MNRPIRITSAVLVLLSMSSLNAGPVSAAPSLVWSTFDGGTSTDYGAAVATDAAGNFYVVGTTMSADYPTTAGAFQRVKGYDRDACVTKLKADGTTVLWSTFLGGNGVDNGLAVAVDSTGAVYVGGSTSSTNLPITSGAPRPTYGGGTSDGFVAKLSSSGGQLLYCTYLGGSQNDLVLSIAVDRSGNLTAGGYTGSTDFPVTPGVLRTYRSGAFPDAADGFVTKVDAPGTHLVYSTYIGADGGTDEVFGVALDAQGRATVTGMTESPAFPVTASAYDRTYNMYWDGFVARLNDTGSAFVYSSYIGGNGDDEPWGVALDAGGNAYVTGWTSSTNFPTTSGAAQAGYGGGTWDAFVAKFAPNGSTLAYGTYVGGSGSDQANAIVVTASGQACLTGTTDSPNFPTSASAYDRTANGVQDAFVSCLSPAGTAISYSTYLGGSGSDLSRGLAIRPNLTLAVLGYTNSSTFPTTPQAWDQSLNGSGTYDGFATVVDAGLGAVTAVPPPGPTVVDLAPPWPNPFSGSTSVALSLERAGRATLTLYDLQGRLVRVLVDRDLPAGRQNWAWDGLDERGRVAGSGVYILRASAGGTHMACRVVKLN